MKAPSVRNRSSSGCVPSPSRLSAGDPVADGSGRMFDAIAPRYDRLNRILSLGCDVRWRNHAVRALALEPGQRVLDVATGTADLAIALARGRSGVEVVGVDPSARMLEVGRRKVERAGLGARVRLEQADGLDLPFEGASFDAACVAFGIRNFRDRELGLLEMARVVRPGGRVAVLELSEPRRGMLAPFARFYIRALVPRIGGLLARAQQYRYLQESVAAFPPAEVFASMMRRAGLADPTIRPLTFGVVHLYTARVPDDQAADGAPPAGSVSSHRGAGRTLDPAAGDPAARAAARSIMAARSRAVEVSG